jgi:hypothetical protein
VGRDMTGWMNAAKKANSSPRPSGRARNNANERPGDVSGAMTRQRPDGAATSNGAASGSDRREPLKRHPAEQLLDNP